MRKRIFVLGAALLVLAMLAGACAGEGALDEGDGDAAAGDEATEPAADAGATEAATEPDGDGGGTVIVGSANFPEQLILANIYADLVESTGATVERRLNLGSREVIWPAMESGEINLLPEYNGALLAFLTEGESTAVEPDEVTEQLREELPEGIVALEPAEAQDKDGLAVTQETAEEYGLESIGDLADVAGELVVGGPAEMEEREVGLPGLREVYGVEFAEFRPLDAGGPLTTEALISGQIDVGRVFTTQGVIEEEGWVLLDDPENLSPAQNIIPVVHADVLTDEIESVLNELSATLTTEDLTSLNRQVEVEQADPEAVASGYLEEEGLLGEE